MGEGSNFGFWSIRNKSMTAVSGFSTYRRDGKTSTPVKTRETETAEWRGGDGEERRKKKSYEKRGAGSARPGLHVALLPCYVFWGVFHRYQGSTENRSSCCFRRTRSLSSDFYPPIPRYASIVSCKLLEPLYTPSQRRARPPTPLPFSSPPHSSLNSPSPSPPPLLPGTPSSFAQYGAFS